MGHGEVNPEELLAHPNNARVHPKNQRDALQGAINDLGFIRSVTVTKDGTVIDGHLRVALALSEHQATIPVEIVDLNEDETREALLTLDPIAALAAYDKEQLDSLLRGVQTGEAAVQAMLGELAAKAGVADAEPPAFKEFDESVADDVEMCTCPKCGHAFPK